MAVEATTWDGAYPIDLTTIRDSLASFSELLTEQKILDMDGQDITTKFTIVQAALNEIDLKLTHNQDISKNAIEKLVDSVSSLGNDLHSKINSVSGLAEDELDAFKAKIEVLRNINVDTISDLINGQRQVIELLNGMTDTIELPQMAINSTANGTLVIDISSLGFAAGDVYSISAIADNTLVNVSLDRPNSDHTKATLFLRDTRYDFVKGFDTTAQAVSLDLTLTHKNRAKITNSVTRVDNIDDTDTANDTKEEVVVGE
jgi:hypothetical protein